MSWNQVTEDTVWNCFKKGGFLRESVIELPEENMQSSDLIKKKRAQQQDDNRQKHFCCS